MAERVTVRSALVPLALMWVVVLLGMVFLTDSAGTRIGMAVIGASATLGLMLRAWRDAHRT